MLSVPAHFKVFCGVSLKDNDINNNNNNNDNDNNNNKTKTTKQINKQDGTCTCMLFFPQNQIMT